jgi:hypothetical protein
MSRRTQGGALVVGLLVLTLVMLLGLAGVGAARIELLVAQNETFRENAVTAASAGIEMAINQISSTDLMSDTLVSGTLPGSAVYEAQVRFVGIERALPGAPAPPLAGAHFEIISTGHSARNAIDRQRAGVMRLERGGLERLYWQRVRIE